MEGGREREVGRGREGDWEGRRVGEREREGGRGTEGEVETKGGRERGKERESKR